LNVFAHGNYDRIKRREQNYADHLHIHLLPQKKRKYQKKTKNNESDKVNSSASYIERKRVFTKLKKTGEKEILKHQHLVPKLDIISNHQPYLLVKLQI
jgi:diadenosine tetraphosphate (Ap4A) HIT family hydrolase